MVLFILTLLLLIFLCVYKIWKHETSRSMKLFNKIPGPRPLPIIGNVLIIFKDPVGIFYMARNLANQYKGIMKLRILNSIGVNIYDPRDIEIVLSNHKHLTKGYIYRFVHPWLEDGLLTSTGEKWQTRRKILTPSFHFNILREFCNVFFEHSDVLVQKLKFEVNKTETLILPFLTEYTLNSISETAMGTNLNSVQGDIKDYKKSIYKIGELIISRFSKFWLYADPIYNLCEEGKQHTKTLAKLHNFTSSVIKGRRNERQISGDKFSVTNYFEGDANTFKKRLAMLDLLLTAEDNGNIDEIGIREEVNTFMFEGHDTTTVGLLYFFMLIANHQDVQDRIVAEINEIFEDKNDPVSIEKLNKMNYLERCIKESLRLYPSVPYIGRNISEDLQLSNYLIPAGTQCGINIFDIHRDAKLFPNPDKFDPDRFLPENSKNRHPYAYIPFSAGPRNCIGQKFAILEEKAVISAVLKNFKLEAVTKPDDIVFIADIVLRCRDPIKIKFVQR